MDERLAAGKNSLTGIHLNQAAHERTSYKHKALVKTAVNKAEQKHDEANRSLISVNKDEQKHDEANRSLSSVNKDEKKHDKANRSLSSVTKAKKKT